jgi:hypothetical protein
MFDESGKIFASERFSAGKSELNRAHGPRLGKYPLPFFRGELVGMHRIIDRV